MPETARTLRTALISLLSTFLGSRYCMFWYGRWRCIIHRKASEVTVRVLLLVQIKFQNFHGGCFICQVPGFMYGHRRVSNNNNFSRTDVPRCLQATTFVAVPDASKFYYVWRRGPCCTFGDKILLAGAKNVVCYGVLCECRQLCQVTAELTLATFPTKTISVNHTFQNRLVRPFFYRYHIWNLKI
jgi:hypothetical protein